MDNNEKNLNEFIDDYLKSNYKAAPGEPTPEQRQRESDNTEKSAYMKSQTEHLFGGYASPVPNDLKKPGNKANATPISDERLTAIGIYETLQNVKQTVEEWVRKQETKDRRDIAGEMFAAIQGAKPTVNIDAAKIAELQEEAEAQAEHLRLIETKEAYIRVYSVDSWEGWYFDLYLPDIMSPFYLAHADRTAYPSYVEALKVGVRYYRELKRMEGE